MTFELTTGVIDRKMPVYSYVQNCKGGTSKRLRIVVAIGSVIAGVLLFYWAAGNFGYLHAIYDADTSSKVQPTTQFTNIKGVTNTNTIKIGTYDVDWYTLASVDVPFDVIAGKQVNFKLDLSNRIQLATSVVVTITDIGGQHVLYFPRTHRNLIDEVQFQYTFPYLVCTMLI